MKLQKKLFILFALIGIIAASSSPKRHRPRDYHDDDDNIPKEYEEYWDDVEGGPFEFTGKYRVYHIAADEVEWDYAPNKTNLINGSAFDANGIDFTNSTETRIGSTYLKCLYREYADDTFMTRIPRKQDDLHLGYLGPIVRAEVGDIIIIKFKNNCRFPASVHPHAVFYQKNSEGAPYNDTTSGFNKSDDAVPQGGKHTYKWFVPKRAGPGPQDGSSIMWMYHSHTDETIDVYAGLVGPMSITRKGCANKDGGPKDVDRELFFMYMVTDENESPYLEENFDRFSLAADGAPLPGGGFAGSNQKANINGWIYGNGHVTTIKKCENVRWYVMSMGSFFDSHTPTFHGNTCVMMGIRTNMFSLLPAEMATCDMNPDAKGKWIFQCHVADHFIDGMAVFYEVKENPNKDEYCRDYKYDNDSYDDDNDDYDY